jgi:REP element-mobilizing transposase RayT
MSYNPVVHHRRSIRLPGHDYTQPGAYYITICTHRREWLFGNVVDGAMRLSPWGQVVAARWRVIPRTFRHVKLDEWVVMPNHVHGIIWIVEHGTVSAVKVDGAEAGHVPPPSADNDGRPRGVAPGSVGAIVGSLKSVATRRINRIRRAPGAHLWQRGYWEHIVRNEYDLERIRDYIRANPTRWERDRNRGRRRVEDEVEACLGLQLRYVQGA